MKRKNRAKSWILQSFSWRSKTLKSIAYNIIIQFVEWEQFCHLLVTFFTCFTYLLTTEHIPRASLPLRSTVIVLFHASKHGPHGTQWGTIPVVPAAHLSQLMPATLSRQRQCPVWRSHCSLTEPSMLHWQPAKPSSKFCAVTTRCVHTVRYDFNRDLQHKTQIFSGLSRQDLDRYVNITLVSFLDIDSMCQRINANVIGYRILNIYMESALFRFRLTSITHELWWNRTW